MGFGFWWGREGEGIIALHSGGVIDLQHWSFGFGELHRASEIPPGRSLMGL